MAGSPDNASSWQTERLTETVYRLVREQVIEGHLLPGEHLDTRALQRRFMAGTPLLREVLGRLAAERLLIHVPLRGYFVQPASTACLLDLYGWLHLVLRAALYDTRVAWASVLGEWAPLPMEKDATGLQSGPVETAHDWAAFEETVFERIVVTVNREEGGRVIDSLIARTHFFRRLELEDDGHRRQVVCDLAALHKALADGGSTEARHIVERMIANKVARLPDLMSKIRAMCLQSGACFLAGPPGSR